MQYGISKGKTKPMRVVKQPAQCKPGVQDEMIGRLMSFAILCIREYRGKRPNAERVTDIAQSARYCADE